MPQITASMAIPNNTALLIRGKDASSILELHKENKHFLSVLFSPHQEKEIDMIFNKLLLEDRYNSLLQNVSIYLSVHVEEEEDLLLALETSKSYNQLLLNFRDTLCKRFGGKSFLYRDNNIYTLRIDDRLLYLNHQNGLLLITFSENLMRRAMNKLILKDDYMQYVIDVFPGKGNKNTDIHLYVQYRYFVPYLKSRIQRRGGGDIAVVDMLRSFCWSIFDLNIKGRDVLLSGYTTMDTASDRSILFIHKNNKLDFYKMLPSEANCVFSIRANHADDFMRIKSAVKPTEDIFSLIYPNHILTFELENDTDCFKYLLIKSENISEASFYLFNSIINSFVDNHYILDTLQIGSLLIGHIDLSNFVYTRLGINSHLPQLEYYTVIDDYILFTNKKEGMQTYINELRKNKTLKVSEQYQSMENYFPKEANLLYYYNFVNMKQENDNNSGYQYYKNTIQFMRMQFYVQSDTILLSNVVFRME
jgi:hypothetical protein